MSEKQVRPVHIAVRKVMEGASPLPSGWNYALPTTTLASTATGGNYALPTTTLASTATEGTTLTTYAATRTRLKSSQETSPHLASVKELYLMPSVLSPHPTTRTEAREPYLWTTTSTTTSTEAREPYHWTTTSTTTSTEAREPYHWTTTSTTTSTEAREPYHWTTTSTTNCVMRGRSEHQTPNHLSTSQSGCCQKTS